jgi:alcohol dehydrogenase
MIAQALGARVVAVDRSPAALALAERLGAEPVPAGEDAVERVVEATGGGAHATLDAVGSAETASAGVRSLRRQGRHVQVGLLATAVPELPLDRVIGWELEVLGSHGMAASDYPEMLALVASGRLRPQELVGGAVGFAEAARLLETAESAPPTGIAVLHPAG